MIKLHDMTIRLCAGVKTLQEVVDVLAPIIHVFSCRIYGLLKYKKGEKMKAYKTEIYPTQAQIELIHKTFGCTRYVYNQYVYENLENLASGRDFISAFSYSKMMNNDPNTPAWLKEVPSKAVKQALIYAERAFRDYFSRRKGKPKFKKKGTNDSFYLIGT